MTWTFKQVAFNLSEAGSGRSKDQKRLFLFRMEGEGAGATKGLAEKEQSTRKPGERCGALVGQRWAAPEPGKRLGNTGGFEARVM